MKVTEYISEKYEGKVFSKEFCLHDLISDIKEFDYDTIREICIDFLDMMVGDIINENDYFLFPIWNFAYMNIVDVCNINHPDYIYDVLNGTDSHFQPVIKGDGMRKMIDGFYPNYLVRFIGKTKKLFESVISQGHHY